MLIIFFILGLIIGSFLNVIVYRLSVTETILGRSYCPHCKAKIRWYDNIPLLSFILLQSRCRDCQEKISWQYPLVELASGIIFALTAYYFFNPQSYVGWVEALMYLGFFSVLLVVFVYDLRFMEIPMIAIWLGIVWVSVCLLLSDWSNAIPITGITSWKILSGVLGGGVSFLFFFSLAYFSKEKWMGMGDAYVGFLLGLAAGWPNIIFHLTLGFMFGAIYSIILIVLGQKTMKSQVPLAPFLVLGSLVAIFAGEFLAGTNQWPEYLMGL